MHSSGGVLPADGSAQSRTPPAQLLLHYWGSSEFNRAGLEMGTADRAGAPHLPLLSPSKNHFRAWGIFDTTSWSAINNLIEPWSSLSCASSQDLPLQDQHKPTAAQFNFFFFWSGRCTKFQSYFIGEKRKKHEPNFEIKSWNSEALLAVQLTGHQSLNFAFNLSFPNTLSLTIIWVKNKRKQRWNVNDLNACICSFVKCIMQLQDFSSYFGHKSRGKWFTYNTVNFLSNFSAKMQLPASISVYPECCFAFIWVLSLEYTKTKTLPEHFLLLQILSQQLSAC